MSIVAVSTVPGDACHTRYPHFDSSKLVAAMLVQQPRYVDSADARWDENATFIAAARVDVPRLVAEVRRLRSLIAGALGDLDRRDEITAGDVLKHA